MPGGLQTVSQGVLGLGRRIVSFRFGGSSRFSFTHHLFFNLTGQKTRMLFLANLCFLLDQPLQLVDLGGESLFPSGQLGNETLSLFHLSGELDCREKCPSGHRAEDRWAQNGMETLTVFCLEPSPLVGEVGDLPRVLLMLGLELHQLVLQ